MKKVSHSSMRKNNRLLVVKMIKDLGPISRADISRKTGLTKSTVSEIVSYFMDMGIVKEVGAKSRYGVGRKGILLDMDSNDHLIIGYDVGTINSRVILTNLKGEIIRKKRFKTTRGEKDLIVQIEKNILEIAGEDWERVVEIGFGVPGMVDRKTGTIIHSPNLGLKDFPFLKVISDEIKKRVVMEHNVKLMMIAEMVYGSARNHSNILLVNIGPGIGSSFVSEGHLVRGSRNFSGEIGHINVVPDGDVCRCGRRGCLETVSAAWGIVRQYEKRSGEKLQDIYGADEVAERARKGDEDAIEVFKDAGKYLGRVLAYTANILDPEIILIGGGLSKSWDLMSEELKREFEGNIIPPIQGKIDISISNLGEFSTAIGASTIAMEDFIRSLSSS